MQGSEQNIVIQKRPDGNTSVGLMIGEERVSGLTIVPFVIRIGSAEFRMDGVAGVWTAESHRMKGYSRYVIESAIDYMANGDAAITMLYGIRDFYPKFGYTTVGPDYFVSLVNLNTKSNMPAGWSARPFTLADLPIVRDIYRKGVSQASGAVVRPDDGKVWSLLIKMVESGDNDCRVILGPDGKIHAYAWLAKKSHSVMNLLSPRFADTLIVGEPVADSPASADALLAVCRCWAQELSSERNIQNLFLAVTPGTNIAAAVMRQDARVFGDYDASGGYMARVLDVKRLLNVLAPEISLKLKAANSTFTGKLVIRTDIGDAALMIDHENICIECAVEKSEGIVVEMPQTALVRLALGTFPPEDILARLPEPPDDAVSKLIQTIFPPRHPQIYPADRF